MIARPRTSPALWLALLALLAVAPAASAQRPSVDAPSAIVLEAGSGRVAYDKAADERRPVGSTTKLMTALLVLESGDLGETVTVGRYRAAPAESLLTPPLTEGEQMTVADLLRGMLLTSANDGAQALAIHDAGSVPAFVRRMNRRADQLGMDNTNFGNPIGLDEGDNYSSARDLATLTLQLRRFRAFRRIVDAETLTLRSGSRTRRIDNRNDLLGEFGWVTGVKTGFTQAAGWCMVSSGRRRGVDIVAVALGAPSEDARDDVSAALLNYGFSRFVLRTSVQRGRVVARVPIAGRAGATLPVVTGQAVRSVIPRGADVELEPRLPASVQGPVAFGDDIGELVVSVADEPVAAVPLRANFSVPAPSAARRAQDAVLGPWTLIAFGGALLLGAALTMLRRGPPARRRADDLGEPGRA